MDDITKKEIGIGILKVSISSIPYVGSLINEILFDIRGRIKQERINNLVGILDERVNAIDELNKEIIYSEEFSDLIEKIFIKASQTKSKEKAKLYGDMLLNAFIASDLLTIDKTDFYLDIISNLSTNEIIILKHLLIKYNDSNSDLNNYSDYYFQIDYNQETIFGLDKDDFKLHFESLISKNLIYDNSLNSIGGYSRNKIGFTYMGHKLILFLLHLK